MNAPDPLRLRGSIGDILVGRGLLQRSDVQSIIERQRDRHEPFGASAVALGLVSQQDLDAALSSQFAYDYLREGEQGIDPSIVAAFKPFSSAAEDLRALRSQLMLRWFQVEPQRRVLAIVSQLPGDGRSHIAANLAVVFAQQGQRTLLIDADLRRPRQGHLFRIPHSAGLAGILSGRVGSGEVITHVKDLPDLSVLPAGALPPNPQELVGMPVFSHLLAQISTQYDVTLIDTPACKNWADAELIAARSGAALLVARKHKSQLKAITDLSRQLQDSGVLLVGSVLNQH